MSDFLPHSADCSTDGAVTKVVGEAFDILCDDLSGAACVPVVREVLARRVAEVQRKTGELDARSLASAAIKSLGTLL